MKLKHTAQTAMFFLESNQLVSSLHGCGCERKNDFHLRLFSQRIVCHMSKAIETLGTQASL